jgi:hypothetical protein
MGKTAAHSIRWSALSCDEPGRPTRSALKFKLAKLMQCTTAMNVQSEDQTPFFHSEVVRMIQ